MAKGSKRGGTGVGGVTDPTFSWAGGDVGSSGGPIFGFGASGFDPGEMGRAFGHDTAVAYGKGPSEFERSLFAGMTPQTRGLIDTALGGPMADVASGAWLEGGNPHFEDLLRRSLGNTRTAVNQTFSNSGRLGSGKHVESLTDALAGQETAARANQFETEYGRMGDAFSRLLPMSNMLDDEKAGELAGEADLFYRMRDKDLSHIGNFMNMFNAGQFEDQPNPWTNVFRTGLGILGAL